MTQNLHAFLEEILRDRKLDEVELMRVCDYITADGVLDLQDVELLVKLYTEANSHPPQFDELFFGVLKAVILDDGQILDNERFFLLKMLYSSPEVSAREIEFLEHLKEEADQVSPEFEQMLADAKESFSQGHDVGGRAQ